MKKFLSIIVVILLLICTAHSAHAGAVSPSISIDGGAVPAGGLGAGTNAKGDIVSVIAGLALASQGVTVQTAEDSTITPIEFIKQSLIDYANAVGITFEELCNTWLDNVKLLADGTFTFGVDNSKAIYQWLAYLVNDDSIMNPANNGSIVILGDVNCPVIMPGETLDFMQENNKVVSIKNTSNYTYSICYSVSTGVQLYYLFSDHNVFQYQLFYNGVYSVYRNETGENNNGIYFRNFMTSSNTVPYVPFIENFNQAISNLNGNFQVSLDLPDYDCFVGDVSNVNPSDFQPSSGNVNILDSGLNLSTLATQYGSSGTVKIKNYIDALKDVINGVENPTLKVNNDDTGILDYLPFVPSSVTIGEDHEGSASSGQVIIDDDQYPSAEESQEYLSHMQFNLAGIFPFCIPFDIVAILSKLDVAPVTPQVSLDFPMPFSEDPLELDLDFSQWNGIAEIARKMELLAFVVGLAVVTRNLIRG